MIRVDEKYFVLFPISHDASILGMVSRIKYLEHILAQEFANNSLDHFFAILSMCWRKHTTWRNENRIRRNITNITVTRSLHCYLLIIKKIILAGPWSLYSLIWIQVIKISSRLACVLRRHTTFVKQDSFSVFIGILIYSMLVIL